MKFTDDLLRILIVVTLLCVWTICGLLVFNNDDYGKFWIVVWLLAYMWYLFLIVMGSRK